MPPILSPGSATPSAVAAGRRRGRLPLVLLAVACTAVGWTAHRAWTDPVIEFLPPGAAPWWVAPAVPLDPLGAPVEFHAALPAGRVADTATLRLRAFRRAELRVDGREVPLPATVSWKRPLEVDLAPYLGAGAARLSVVVRNPSGPPALSVASDAPRLIGLTWRARPAGAAAPGPPAVATGRRQGTGGPWPWAALIVIATWVLLLGRGGGREGDRAPLSRNPPAGEAASSPRRRGAAKAVPWLLAVLTVAVLAADLRNSRHYPPARGYDAWGHLEYVDRLAAGQGLPAADEGWQAYQPPLYYLAAAAFGGGASPAPGQLLNCLAHAALGLLAFAYCRWLFPHRPAAVALLAAATALALPAGLCLAPMVTNEPFAGSLAAAAFLATGLLAGRPPRLRQGVLGGGAHAAAMLAKYTAVPAFAASLAAWGCAAVGKRPGRRREHVARLATLALTGLLLAGWFYAGHARDFGDPFVGNWDPATGFHYEQRPGYRDLASLLRFGPALDGTMLHNAALRSIPEGFHVSMWTDPHHFFLARGRRPGSETWLLWLGLVPTALGLAGFAGSWWRSGAAGSFGLALAHFSAVLFTLLVAIALLAFNLELPFFSTAKAHFAWALFPLLAAWSATSLDRLWRLRRWLALPWLLATLAWIVLAWAVFAVGGPAVATGGG